MSLRRSIRAPLVLLAAHVLFSTRAHGQSIELAPLSGATALADPVALASAGDGSGRLFIVLQGGRIVIHDGRTVLATPFLDIQDVVQGGGEHGLLGLAFHPEYPAVPYLYVTYTCLSVPSQPECTLSGSIVIARFQVSADPDVADPASRRALLVIQQPVGNHNGGDLKFGPDGKLWIAMGDGGGVSDPSCFAQRDDSLLGKLLRIDVDQNVDIPPFYGIPPDNPYVGAGDPPDEVFARGLRNPFRFSFDRRTGDLFIGDVGQSHREEVDFQAAGTGAAANYGWSVMEGTSCTGLTSGCPVGIPPCNSPSFTPPILEVDHLTGDCAIIGGYRYRGTAIPAIAGRYLYSDNCTGRIRAATETAPGVWSSAILLDTPLAVAGFGQDEAGELYIAALGTGTGSVHRIHAVPPLLSIQDASAFENDPDRVGSIAFTLSLSHPVAQPVTVQFASAPGTASPVTDYVSVTGAVTFPPTSTTEAVSVDLRGDLIDEFDETFFVDLSNPVNATIADAQGMGTILDNDPLPTLRLDDCTTLEGVLGTVPCVFHPILSAPSDKTVSATWATADGSASAPSDYVAASGSATWPASDPQPVSIAIEVRGDTEPERDESFTVRFTSAENAVIGAGGTGWIVDDERRLVGLAHGITLEDSLVAPSPRLFRMEQAPLASYEVILDGVSGDAAPELRMDRVAAQPGILLQESSPVGTGSARSLRWQNTTTIVVATDHILISTPGCSPACGSDDVFRLRVYETTGRIARFNNSGAQASVVVLQNPGASPLAGLVHFWNDAGKRLFVQPFSLRAGATTVLSTAAIPDLQDASGSISVTHDGSYGSPTGTAVALDPATGYSLAAPLTVRPR